MSSLTKDLLLDAARNRRRTRRTFVTTLTSVFALVLAISFFPHSSQTPLSTTLQQLDPIETSPELPYTPVNSEQELLALLSDQSPILITRPDGSRALVLTNPQ